MKSREEIQIDQRVVLEAKLEDLLRRGSPSDLKAANELMQVLADQVSLNFIISIYSNNCDILGWK